MSKGLHKSKIDYIRDSGDLINRPGYVLNLVTGCKHYQSDICNIDCYARRMVEKGRLKGHPSYPNGFEPTFHPERNMAIGGKPKLIFLNDMGDVGGDWNWRNWKGGFEYIPLDIAINMQMLAIRNPQHILLLLTKNPSWYRFAEWPDNVYCGFSATNNEELYKRMDEMPTGISVHRRWMSLEPWLDEDNPHLQYVMSWLVIGGQSGPNAMPVSMATLEWLLNRGIQAKRFTKSNALAGMPKEIELPLQDIYSLPREYPDGWKVQIEG